MLQHQSKKKEGEIVSNDKIKDALQKLEDVALAYTVKTSSATTPEQFLDDYVSNIELFKEIKNQHPSKWTI